MPVRSSTWSLTLALAIALGACSGEIAAPKDPETGGNAVPGGNDPGAPPAVPGGPPGSPGATACAPTALPQARAWRLSHNQLKNTLLDVFGFAGTAVDGLPPDARLYGFGNDATRLGFSPVLMEHYFRVGDEVAADVLRRSGEFFKCPMAALGEGTCLADFFKSVGRRAWRRPLEENEQKELTAVYVTAAKADGPDSGLKSLISALLLSPNFLFRTELGAGAGNGSVRLTDYELASALSYMLWDAPPDNGLLDLAAAGKLRDPAVLASEARRLFTSGKRGPDAMNNFLRQWLKIDDLAEKKKDTALYPFYTDAVGQDLMEETRLLFDEVVFAPGGDRSVKTLFTSTRGYANARTASIYGVNASGDALARVDLDATRRRGLLTTGAFLAAHAGADVTKVVDRGAFVREEFLCAEVPAPPQNFKFEDAAITEDMTAREKLLIHAKNPACASCHSLFDGIGFALENYDAVGKWRETEKGKKIDSTGVVPLPAGGELRFTNFVDFIDQLAGKPDIYGCFASQYLSYATGRGVREIDSCERSNLLAGFEKSGYRVDALVTGIVTSAAFSTRRN